MCNHETDWRDKLYVGAVWVIVISTIVLLWVQYQLLFGMGSK